MLARAGTTKNDKDARQYVAADMAAALRKHVARKTAKAPAFDLPANMRHADMLRRTWQPPGRHGWTRPAMPLSGAREREREREERFSAA